MLNPQKFNQNLEILKQNKSYDKQAVINLDEDLIDIDVINLDEDLINIDANGDQENLWSPNF